MKAQFLLFSCLLTTLSIVAESKNTKCRDLSSSMVSVKSPKSVFDNSLFVYPKMNDKKVGTGTTFVGIVRDKKNKPVANQDVKLLIDGKIAGIVRTNAAGIWSLKPTKPLTKGWHAAAAYANDTQVFLNYTFFKVVKHQKAQVRSGNADAVNSLIAYPYEGAEVNSKTPQIVGFIMDADNNPVTNETVRLYVDSNLVTTVQSDSNGLFYYTLTSGQQLSEAYHVVGAYAVESNVALTSATFHVDVTPPAAPTITQPANNATLTSHFSTVTGTTEPYANVTIYFNGDSTGLSTDADETGAWSIDVTLPNGSLYVQGQAVDLAFNTGPLSSPVNFTVNA